MTTRIEAALAKAMDGSVRVVDPHYRMSILISEGLWELVTPAELAELLARFPAKFAKDEMK